MDITVRNKDTLERIFIRNKLPLSGLSKWIGTHKKRGAKIYPGQHVQVTLKNKKVENITITDVLKKSPKQLMSRKKVAIKPKKAIPHKVTEKPAVYKKIQFYIKSSLYIDGKKQGLNAKDILAITNVLKNDITINVKKLPSMSKFNVVFSEGSKPHVISLDIEYKGKKWSATEFKAPGNRLQYYHDDGSSLSSSFLRYPLKNFYVSSEFSPNRIHPILHVKRPHYGVDFAASYGTPIWATAPGKIEFVGTKGGYGKVIVIRHDKQYTTTYAHLSRFSKAAKEGEKVEEKQIIGYVGKSGIATGSHLHYEIRKDGVPINPLGNKLPEKTFLSGSALKYFKKFRAMLVEGY